MNRLLIATIEFMIAINVARIFQVWRRCEPIYSDFILTRERKIPKMPLLSLQLGV